jgi:hypothetical protein
MDTLDDILTKHNWPEMTTPGKVDTADIETKIGFELPNDYKYFISNYTGHETQMGQEFFKLWGKENLMLLNKEYKILEHLPATFGIGDNGGGELIAIEKLEIGDFRIILTPFIDLDRQFHIVIGESFTDFLLRIDKGEKWFKDMG